jgi:hypothetical protein
MNKNHEIDIGGVPAQNIQDSLEGLKNAEVRNLNNEVQQSGVSGAEEINRLLEGVASGTSPISSSDPLDANSEVFTDQQKYWDRTRLVEYLERAEEVPNFVSTRNELLQIVKYWVKELVGLEYAHFCYQISGGTETLLRAFVDRRIARITELLGEDEVKQATEEAYEEFGKEQDPKVWKVFLAGTKEEREAVQEEIDRKMQEWIPSNQQKENDELTESS